MTSVYLVCVEEGTLDDKFVVYIVLQPNEYK